MNMTQPYCDLFQSKINRSKTFKFFDLFVFQSFILWNYQSVKTLCSEKVREGNWPFMVFTRSVPMQSRLQNKIRKIRSGWSRKNFFGKYAKFIKKKEKKKRVERACFQKVKLAIKRFW